MNWQDYIVGLIVAAALFLTLRHFVRIVRGKKSGCSSCGQCDCCKTKGKHKQCPSERH